MRRKGHRQMRNKIQVEETGGSRQGREKRKQEEKRPGKASQFKRLRLCAPSITIDPVR